MKRGLLLLAAVMMSSQFAMASRLQLECTNDKEMEIKRDKKAGTEELLPIEKLKDKANALHQVRINSNGDLTLVRYVKSKTDKNAVELETQKFDGSFSEPEKRGLIPGKKTDGLVFDGFSEQILPEKSRGSIDVFVKEATTNFDEKKLFEAEVTYYPPSRRADGRDKVEAGLVCTGTLVDD